MRRCRWLLCSLCVLAGISFTTIQGPGGAVCAEAQVDPGLVETRELIRRYTTRPLTTRFDDETVRIRAVITAIENDDKKRDDLHSPDTFRDATYHGCEVSTTGRVGSFYHHPLGEKGGGYPELPADDLKRLEHLLARLPDEGAMLPPPGRRLGPACGRRRASANASLRSGECTGRGSGDNSSQSVPD